jgi:adenine phosphoribosyltransferase
MELVQALSLIRTIPDYPAPGILFQDITPLIGDGSAFSTVIKAMAAPLPSDHVVAGVEARGFIFGAAIATELGVGFIPIRKKGKLPYSTISRDYGLEYGRDEIEMHVDSLSTGQRVILIDDVLATGGTLIAAIELIGLGGGTVEAIAVLSEISELNGRKKILERFPNITIHTLIS